MLTVTQSGRTWRFSGPRVFEAGILAALTAGPVTITYEDANVALDRDAVGGGDSRGEMFVPALDTGVGFSIDHTGTPMQGAASGRIAVPTLDGEGTTVAGAR